MNTIASFNSESMSDPKSEENNRLVARKPGNSKPTMMIGKTLDQRKITIHSYADPPSQRFKLPSYLHLLKSSKTAFEEDF